MRCKVGPGFKAVVGVGNDVKYAAGEITPPDSPACDIKAPPNKLQILSDLYDSENPLYDEDHNYAPGVLMCEFAATDADNIVDSFAKTVPFHVDKRDKLAYNQYGIAPAILPAVGLRWRRLERGDAFGERHDEK